MVEEGTGQILGCPLFCAEAGEVTTTVQVTMKAGVRYEVLRDTFTFILQ
ncbi:hypothetical protein [Hymenobacter sp. GOD-10R]